MGTLEGHLLPGSMFIVFGIWWGFITSLRYVQMRYHHSRSRAQNLLSYDNGQSKSNRFDYKSTTWMPCVCMPCSNRIRRAPIECWIQLIFGSIGVIGEFLTAFSPKVS